MPVELLENIFKISETSYVNFADLNLLFVCQAGLLGLISILVISLHSKMHIFITVLLLTAISGGVAIADVTIDACSARNSILYPLLAADIQSLCGMSLSIGALLGFSTSGVAVHVLGAQVLFFIFLFP